jgi:hypothetical protein
MTAVFTPVSVIVLLYNDCSLYHSLCSTGDALAVSARMLLDRGLVVTAQHAVCQSSAAYKEGSLLRRRKRLDELEVEVDEFIISLARTQCARAHELYQESLVMNHVIGDECENVQRAPEISRLLNAAETLLGESGSGVASASHGALYLLSHLSDSVRKEIGGGWGGGGVKALSLREDGDEKSCESGRRHVLANCMMLRVKCQELSMRVNLRFKAEAIIVAARAALDRLVHLFMYRY